MKTVSVVYTGPSATNRVPSLGVVAVRDVPIDVDENVAKVLLKKPCYQEAKPPKPASAATKETK